MIYADFVYYKTQYIGAMITDPAVYDRCATRAAADIDYYTLGRAAKNADMDAVKMAACAVAEQYQTIERSAMQSCGDAPELQSESVGSYSRTYRSASESASDAKAAIRGIIEKYLAHTGLLYRGVNGCLHHTV